MSPAGLCWFSGFRCESLGSEEQSWAVLLLFPVIKQLKPQRAHPAAQSSRLCSGYLSWAAVFFLSERLRVFPLYRLINFSIFFGLVFNLALSTSQVGLTFRVK